MSNPGRPRALDEYKRREICALISVGCGIEGAAKYVGVRPITIRREALRNPEFHKQLCNAELASELEPLRAIRKAADTHWRAGAWLLERTRPERFSRRPHDSLTREQLAYFSSQFANTIMDAIPDEETRQRVADCIRQMSIDARHNLRAIEHVRRDPRRFRQMRRPSPPKPAWDDDEGQLPPNSDS
jgi:hypothetical protein